MIDVLCADLGLLVRRVSGCTLPVDAEVVQQFVAQDAVNFLEAVRKVAEVAGSLTEIVGERAV